MLDTLLEITRDMGRAVPDERLYARLLEHVREVVPCDASALLRYDDGVLVPLAVDGLSAQVLARRFRCDEHPRLAALCEADGPLRFSPDDSRPDPFDGLVAGAVDGHTDVHACMGCTLRLGDELVGLLTIDAFDPRAFDDVDHEAVAMFAALAAATMRIATMFQALSSELDRCHNVARSIVQERLQRDGALLGTSLPMQQLRREVTAVARSGVPVLVLGETGTGKELVARTIHAESDRADRPLVYVNCAALPEGLAESEFFGHMRGAFTGATATRPGKFELAHTGTLFLDEIGELPPSIQPKLLRALQEGELQRVGADQTRRVDVRVVAATNRDLEAEVEAGSFRADLYHRLSVYPVTVPPLSVRGDDVMLLAGAFLDRACAQLGLERATLTDEALDALCAYDWPGNVRELQHVIMRSVIRGRGAAVDGAVVIDASLLDVRPAGGREDEEVEASPTTAGDGLPDLAEATEAFQRRLVQRAVARYRGNWSAAARALGVDRSNLHRTARRLGLK